MIDEHAPLPPSGSPQWGICSGSILANMHAPDIDTEEKREGTAGHWVMEQCLLRWRDPDGGSPSCFEWVGKVAPNGVIIDEKMAEGAQVIVDDVLTVCNQYGGLRNLLIEFRVHMPRIHEHNWGTLDVSLFVPEAALLFIWDYKGGHRENRAKENLQLIDYTQGLIEHHGIDGHADQHITASLRIVQPFCYKAKGPIDEWRVLLSDLRPYFNQLHGKAHEAFINPLLSTGPHCRDCAAVGKCSAQRKATYNLIDYANQPYEMDAMSGAELAVERSILIDGLAAAKSRLEAIEDDLQLRVSDGATDTGLALETKYGHIKWTVPYDQAIAFASQFQVDAQKKAAITPTQTIAAAPREMRPCIEQAIKAVSTRPAGGLKLTNADDTIGARAFKRK